MDGKYDISPPPLLSPSESVSPIDSIVWVHSVLAADLLNCRPIVVIGNKLM